MTGGVLIRYIKFSGRREVRDLTADGIKRSGVSVAGYLYNAPVISRADEGVLTWVSQH